MSELVFRKDTCDEDILLVASKSGLSWAGDRDCCCECDCCWVVPSFGVGISNTTNDEKSGADGPSRFQNPSFYGCYGGPLVSIPNQDNIKVNFYDSSFCNCPSCGEDDSSDNVQKRTCDCPQSVDLVTNWSIDGTTNVNINLKGNLPRDWDANLGLLELWYSRAQLKISKKECGSTNTVADLTIFNNTYDRPENKDFCSMIELAAQSSIMMTSGCYQLNFSAIVAPWWSYQSLIDDTVSWGVKDSYVTLELTLDNPSVRTSKSGIPCGSFCTYVEGCSDSTPLLEGLVGVSCMGGAVKVPGLISEPPLKIKTCVGAQNILPGEIVPNNLELLTSCAGNCFTEDPSCLKKTEYVCCIKDCYNDSLILDSTDQVYTDVFCGECKKNTRTICSGTVPCINTSSTADCSQELLANQAALVFDTKKECEESCIKYVCENDACTKVITCSNTNKTYYVSREECELICEGKFDCVNKECVQVGPNGQFDTREDCENSDCEGKFSCQDNAECVQNDDGVYLSRKDCVADCEGRARYKCIGLECVRGLEGPYATVEECAENCIIGDPPGTKYWCVPFNNNKICVSSTTQPPNSLAGPFINKNYCEISCRNYSCLADCTGKLSCYAIVGGGYSSLELCKASCNINNKCDDFIINGPGTYISPENVGNIYICWKNKTAKPIKVQIRFFDPCAFTTNPFVQGVWNIIQPKYWSGHPNCRCADLNGKGELKPIYEGVINWKKSPAVTLFEVKILTACGAILEDVEIKGGCGNSYQQVNGVFTNLCSSLGKGGAEALAPCCYNVGATKICVDNVTKNGCIVGLSGTWYEEKICKTCNEVECETGGCCQRGDIKTQPICIDNYTQAQCDSISGVFLGVGNACSGCVKEIEACSTLPTGGCVWSWNNDMRKWILQSDNCTVVEGGVIKNWCSCNAIVGQAFEPGAGYNVPNYSPIGEIPPVTTACSTLRNLDGSIPMQSISCCYHPCCINFPNYPDTYCSQESEFSCASYSGVYYSGLNLCSEFIECGGACCTEDNQIPCWVAENASACASGATIGGINYPSGIYIPGRKCDDKICACECVYLTEIVDGIPTYKIETQNPFPITNTSIKGIPARVSVDIIDQSFGSPSYRFSIKLNTDCDSTGISANQCGTYTVTPIIDSQCKNVMIRNNGINFLKTDLKINGNKITNYPGQPYCMEPYTFQPSGAFTLELEGGECFAVLELISYPDGGYPAHGAEITFVLTCSQGIWTMSQIRSVYSRDRGYLDDINASGITYDPVDETIIQYYNKIKCERSWIFLQNTTEKLWEDITIQCDRKTKLPIGKYDLNNYPIRSSYCSAIARDISKFFPGTSVDVTSQVSGEFLNSVVIPVIEFKPKDIVI